jgi:hypothetical protein
MKAQTRDYSNKTSLTVIPMVGFSTQPYTNQISSNEPDMVLCLNVRLDCNNQSFLPSRMSLISSASSSSSNTSATNSTVLPLFTIAVCRLHILEFDRLGEKHRCSFAVPTPLRALQHFSLLTSLLSRSKATSLIIHECSVLSICSNSNDSISESRGIISLTH